MRKPESASTAEAPYDPDDGPLTDDQIKAIREDAAMHMPKGKTLSEETLFPCQQDTGESGVRFITAYPT